LQFTLRGLFFFSFLVALLCAWLRHEMNRYQEEQEAVAAIEERGGSAGYPADDPFRHDETVTPAWLAPVLGERFSDGVSGVMFPPGATDADLALLGRLRSPEALRYLELNGTAASVQSLAEVWRFRELEDLRLDSTCVTDGDLVNLLGCRRLSRISLNNTAVTDEGMRILRRLPSLIWVDVSGTHVTARGVAELRRDSATPRAVAWATAPSEDCRRAAAILEQRTALVLAEGPSGQGQHVTYSICIVGPLWKGKPSDLAHIGSLQGPLRVKLSEVGFDEDLFAQLARLKEMEVPDLHNVSIHPEQWRRMLAGEFSGARGASVAGRRSASGQTRGWASRLKRLDLTGAWFTDSHLHLVSDLKGVQSLSLTSTSVTDEGLAGVEQLPQLDSLSFCGEGITDDGLGRLKPLHQLRSLRLLQCDNITGAGLVRLAGMQRLEALSLRGSALGDPGMEGLIGLPSLRVLDLSFSHITDAGLEHLGGLSSLRELRLSGTQIADGGLRHLVRLPSLWVLDLSWTQITDAGLEDLAHLKQLESLRLTGCVLHWQAIDRLQAALPNTRIEF